MGAIPRPSLDVSRIWEAFPLPTFRASAPIQVFYDDYP
jgi:hypothetical protein